MKRKLYKEITQENGTLKIYGDEQEIETYYKVPDWREDEEDQDEALELCFDYEGNTYFLSEIMAVHNKFYNPNAPEWMLEFDGYMSDSYFSGILIKLIDNGEAVKAYTYIS